MPSPNQNPFGMFSFGADATATIPTATTTPAARPMPANADDSTRAKKKTRRVREPRAGQEAPKGLSEKYRSPGQPEWPLRLIVVGHNPSEKAWELGHYYANPSNRMWKLLATADIVPASFTASNDDDCPITCGVGFTDVGFSHPGTISSDFKRTELHAWRQSFYHRLIAHAERAAATVATANGERKVTSTLRADEENTEPTSGTALIGPADIKDGYPQVVAFAGKRQFEELFFDAGARTRALTKGGKAGRFRFGLQPADLRPPGWPFPARFTDLFVLPSSSGAAAMANETREAPYVALGSHISRQGSWTRRKSTQR
ncbi:unnamed protein product [Ascophyllum nodosum]